MASRIPVEHLEPRTLLSDTPTPPTPPPSGGGGSPRPRPPVVLGPNNHPGIRRVGRTVYVIGAPDNDFIRVSAAPNGADNQPRPNLIQVQVDASQVVMWAGKMQRFIFNGGAGDDVIRIDPELPESFHPRVIIIRGGDGNDTITGTYRNERIFGDAGNDLIVGSSGNDELDGGAGDDRVDGGYGDDRVFGGDGNDVLIGGPGPDQMLGGAGDDTFRNEESEFERQQAGYRDLLDGGGGNDAAQVAPADRYRLITGRIFA